jgi:hypothetical protein
LFMYLKILLESSVASLIPPFCLPFPLSLINILMFLLIFLNLL